MQKRSELFFNLIRLPLDFLAVLGGFVVAYIIRVQLEGRPVPYPSGGMVFVQFFLLVIPVWILIFALSGLYGQTGQKGRLEEIGKIFTAVSGGTMFLVLLDFLSTEPIFPAKAIIIYGYGLSFLFVVLERTVLRTIQRWLYRYGIGSRRTIIAGTGSIAQQLAEDMAKAGGHRLVAVVDAHPQGQKRMKYVPVYSSIAAAVAKVGEIDEIIQADSELPEEEVLALVEYASHNQVTYRFVPNNFGMYATQSTMQVMAGVPLLEVRKTPLEGWGRIIKRSFDLVGVFFGLLLLLPVFVIVGIAIKLTDPGPVFYKHKRLSRSGKTIYVYKFRSMLVKYSTGEGYTGKTDAEILADTMGRPELVEEFKKAQKLNDDPRVSKVGKFLRKTSIDELPQLINVLRGDMSLVGPRPIVLDEVEHYGKQADIFFALKPGLVGLWQVSGRSDVDYDERVKLDIYYIENWSLWLDIKVLAKAVVTVLTGKGAY